MRFNIFFFLAFIQVATFNPLLALLALNPKINPCNYDRDNWQRQQLNALMNNMVHCVIQVKE